MSRLLGLALLVAAAPALAAPGPDASAAPAPAAKAGPATPPEGWRVVDARDGGFTAWMPGKPDHFDGRRAGVGFVGYGLDASTGPARTFAVLAFGGSDAAGLVANQVAAEVYAGGAKQSEEAPATVDGHAARAVLLLTEQSVIALRRFAAFGREYVALVRFPAGAELPADAATFFDSIRIREQARLPGPRAVAKLPAAKPSRGFAERVLEDGGVALAFPGEPARSSIADGKVTTWTLAAADGRCTFSLKTFSFPDAEPLTDEALDLFALQIADAYGEGVIGTAHATVGGLPARAFEVASGEERLQVRVVRAGNRLHHLLVSAKGATPGEADLATFFGSFRALP